MAASQVLANRCFRPLSIQLQMMHNLFGFGWICVANKCTQQDGVSKMPHYFEWIVCQWHWILECRRLQDLKIADWPPPNFLVFHHSVQVLQRCEETRDCRSDSLCRELCKTGLRWGPCKPLGPQNVTNATLSSFSRLPIYYNINVLLTCRIPSVLMQCLRTICRKMLCLITDSVSILFIPNLKAEWWKLKQKDGNPPEEYWNIQ